MRRHGTLFALLGATGCTPFAVEPGPPSAIVDASTDAPVGTFCSTLAKPAAFCTEFEGPSPSAPFRYADQGDGAQSVVSSAEGLEKTGGIRLSINDRGASGSPDCRLTRSVGSVRTMTLEGSLFVESPVDVTTAVLVRAMFANGTRSFFITLAGRFVDVRGAAAEGNRVTLLEGKPFPRDTWLRFRIEFEVTTGRLAMSIGEQSLETVVPSAPVGEADIVLGPAEPSPPIVGELGVRYDNVAVYTTP